MQLALSLAVLAYAAHLLGQGSVDGFAPLVAAALLLAGELAYTSLEPPARRVWPTIAGTTVAAAVVGALLLGAGGAGRGRLLDLALGVAAAAGAVALVARLAASATRR